MTPEQVRALAAPLNPANVATREQAGQKLSYIESWHAIAEANRIFGFDGWHSETVDLRCVTETERKIGRNKDRDGWGVTYTAKVRITVAGVVREGTGAGSGIDADLGLAHESAIKEAESDARKRALMTFGNPFGLALYDKSHANVQAPPPDLISDDQRDLIATLAEAAGMTLQFICESYQIESLKDLPASKFAALQKRLQQAAADRPQQKEAA